MTKLNVIGVDLAKNVIQVSVLSPSNRELRNCALTRRKFGESYHYMYFYVSEECLHLLETMPRVCKCIYTLELIRQAVVKHL